MNLQELLINTWMEMEVLFALYRNPSPFGCLAESPDIGPSVVVHTSVSFGKEYLEWDKEKVQPLILDQLKEIIPDLPTPASIKCQKWRYSQVISDNC